MIRTAVIASVVWLEMIRKKDIYVLFILMGGLLAALVSLDIFGLGGVVRYVEDIGLLTAWIFAWGMTVNASCRELPHEETTRTIFPLLAKPVTRWKVICGKWLGVWTIMCFATLAFYALVLLVVSAKGGSIDPPTILQAYVLHCAALAVIASIGIAFSTRMNHDAAASLTYVLTGAAFLVVPRIPEFIIREKGIRAAVLTIMYNLLPHFEVFDMRRRAVHDYGPIGPSPFATVLVYGAVLTSLFLLCAWMAYRRKTFSRRDQL